MGEITASTTLVDKAKRYVISYLDKNLPEHITYHDLEHTQSVVEAAGEIGKASGLSEEQLELVLIAAWFHDTGYHLDCDEHEKHSARIAQEFLQKENVSDEKIATIRQIILSTKMPQSPESIEAKVLCDADLYHLATDHFDEISEKLRKEFAYFNPEYQDRSFWLESGFHFMKTHAYFTEYAREKLSPGKEKNLKKLKKERKKKRKELKKLEKQNDKLKSKLERKPDRGVETMFRTTYRSHLDLSNIADNKANIMISINAIIVSIIVSILIRKFEDYPNLVLPTIILITVNLLTIIFAVLATRPKVTSGKFTREDIKSRRTNLLFFGNFHRMSLDEYQWGMNEIMKDADILYGSMIRDIYYLGVVLAKKYKMLRIAYTIFMFGFVLSIIAFTVAILFFPAY